jgi:transposase
MEALMTERLTQERTWTASQLTDEIATAFKVRVTAEAIRQHLKALGYCWKRTRYLPCSEVDAEREHRASLETLKKGLKKDS